MGAAPKVVAAVEADAHLKASSMNLSQGVGFQRLASTSLGRIASIRLMLRQLVQKRRIYLHKAREHFALSSRGSVSPLKQRLLSCSQSSPGSHGVHDWHEAASNGFLTPLEVAQCRTDPDMVLHVERLLENRWAALEDGLELLETL